MALGSRIHSAARHSFRKDRHNHEAGHQSSKPDKDGLGDDDKNPLDKKLLVDGLAGTVGVRDDGQSRRAVFDPTPASHMRYAVRDEPCMTRLTTLAAMPASTALAAGDASMSVIGFDPCA